MQSNGIGTSVSNDSGMTMLNLLVSLAIIGIVGFLGLPQLSVIADSFDRLNARTVFIQDLKQAQAQALTEGCRGIFTFSEGGNVYTFGCDYLGYDVSDPPSADSISFTRILPSDITISPSTQIIFSSRGLPVDASDILNTVAVTFTDSSEGTDFDFATGTLFATGLFSFD